MKSLFLTVATALCLTWQPSSAAFPVIGYWAARSGGPAQIDYKYLTHINYSFARTNGMGALTGVNDGLMRDLVTRAHSAGVEVWISIGGWGTHEDFIAMTSTPAGIDAFVGNCMALCDKYDLGGVDMDWEYPTSSNAALFDTVMRKLSAPLKAKGRGLSTAVAATSGSTIHNVNFGYCDFINIMAYAVGGVDHSSYDLATRSLDYWVRQRGCPKAKAVLGVPFFGRPANSSDETGYRTLVARDPRAPYKDTIGTMHYNGIATIQKKTQLSYDQGGGIMIWEIGLDTHDSTSLLRSIHDKVSSFPVPVHRRPPGTAAAAFSISGGRVRFQAPVAGPCRLTLRSLSGASLLEMSLQAHVPGETSIPWNAVGVGAGPYTATLEGKGFAFSRFFPLLPDTP
jgi:chitinase